MPTPRTPSPARAGRWLRGGALGGAVLLATSTLAMTLTGTATGAGGAHAGHEASAPARPTDLYVVTFDQRPLAQSRRDLTLGERYDADAPGTDARRARLVAAQDAVLGRAGVDAADLRYRYTTTVSGVAADLTPHQARVLRSFDGVAGVGRSARRPLAGDDATGYLGVSGPGGLWERTGGPGRAGRDVVVGVVDTGLWPERPSFAAIPSAGGLRGFTGDCRGGAGWQQSSCNNKVVAARWFVRGFGTDDLSSIEHLGARDAVGHGTSVAALAAGARGVAARVDGESFGQVSGVAPAARIAVYKACWAAPDPADDGCDTADVLAAVDAAVADGVDVLSYAVGGSRVRADDALSRALLTASNAGVFVAAAAGNRGQGSRTVQNTAPWVTTVGASTWTHRQGGVVLADGGSWVGAMASSVRVPPTPVVLASEAAAPGTAPSDAARCGTGTLDPDLVRGEVVVCDRGTVSRLEKSQVVADAGGVAMVLVNTPRGRQSVDADLHAVPTVHLSRADGAELVDWVRTTDEPTVEIDPTRSSYVSTPEVAPFSGRGPSASLRGGVVKPDLLAPGVSLLAPTAPSTHEGRGWDITSGTSLAAAHVAGLAALLASERPAWTAQAARSALMTTASDVASRPRPTGQGAGQVDAQRMLDPGLVVTASSAQYRSFLRGDLRLKDVGLASVSVPSLSRTVRVHRTLTNVGELTETYRASVLGLRGVWRHVRPAVVTLAPGESVDVVLRLTPVTDDPRSGGHLVWRGGAGHVVRLPVLVGAGR